MFLDFQWTAGYPESAKAQLFLDSVATTGRVRANASQMPWAGQGLGRRQHAKETAS